MNKSNNSTELQQLVNNFCTKLPYLTKSINNASDLGRLMKIAQYVHSNNIEIDENMFLKELINRFPENEGKLIINEYASSFYNQVKEVVDLMKSNVIDN